LQAIPIASISISLEIGLSQLEDFFHFVPECVFGDYAFGVVSERFDCAAEEVRTAGVEAFHQYAYSADLFLFLLSSDVN